MCSHVIFNGEYEQRVSFPWKDDCVFDYEEIKRKVIPVFIAPMDISGIKSKL